MGHPTIRRLQDDWEDLQSRLAEQPELSSNDQDDLKQLLDRCIAAGKNISDAIDRESLKWLTREIGDTLFSLTNQYPNIAIASYQGVQIPSKLTCNIPARNPFFTGRSNYLKALQQFFLEDEDRSPLKRQAISGLGGIGKTQVAIEYVYRNLEHYAAIFWIRSRTAAEIQASFWDIAKTLTLPEKDAEQPEKTIRAVKEWLEANDRWLLVFEDADDPKLLQHLQQQNCLPSTSQGHILITSRSQLLDAIGIASPIELKSMDPEEALEFLITRTGRGDSDSTEIEAAAQLAKELGYLPLALEQAAAFITAKKAPFQNYLKSYQQRRLELLEKSLPIAGSYSEPITLTLREGLRDIEQESAAATELLHLSAFLGSENIPIELITQGCSELGPVLAPVLAKVEDDPLVLDELFERPSRYSLISRNLETETYSIHPLVQEVLRNQMEAETRRSWAERSIRAMNQVFPSVDLPPQEIFTPANRQRCERILPHAQAVAKWVQGYNFIFSEAAELLHRVGYYSYLYGQYAEAEPLLSQSLQLFTHLFGESNTQVAQSLNNLAELYRSQGRYDEAKPLYQRALELNQRLLGYDHPEVANSLNNLALLYTSSGLLQAHHDEAEKFYGQALELYQQSLGEKHPTVANSLNNLAELYRIQGRYGEAEPLYQKALEIKKALLGEQHPDFAVSLNNLALLYQEQGQYEAAEKLYRQALQIFQQLPGKELPAMATSLNNLAQLYRMQSRNEEAETLYQQALDLRRRLLGEADPAIAVSLSNLGLLYQEQGEYEKAESLYQQALDLRMRLFGKQHPDSMTSLDNLAWLYQEQGRYQEAESLYRQVLEISKQLFGEEHLDVAINLDKLALLYQDQERYEEAEQFYQQALELRRRILLEDDLDLAVSLDNLAFLYQQQKRYEESERLYRQALDMRKQALGEADLDVAISRDNLAVLYQIQGRYNEAETLLKQALETVESLSGADNPYAVVIREQLNKLRNS